MMSYEEWLGWREEYFEMEDLGEHKNLGVGVVGNLKKKQGKVVDQMVEDFLVVQKITKEKCLKNISMEIN